MRGSCGCPLALALPRRPRGPAQGARGGTARVRTRSLTSEDMGGRQMAYFHEKNTRRYAREKVCRETPQRGIVAIPGTRNGKPLFGQGVIERARGKAHKL